MTVVCMEVQTGGNAVCLPMAAQQRILSPVLVPVRLLATLANRGVDQLPQGLLRSLDSSFAVPEGVPAKTTPSAVAFSLGEHYWSLERRSFSQSARWEVFRYYEQRYIDDLAADRLKAPGPSLAAKLQVGICNRFSRSFL